MRRIVFISSVLIIFVASNCGNRAGNVSNNSVSQPGDTGKAILTFMEYEHNFGKVVEGEKVAYVFRFENNGTSDLLISDAATSCGCTVPKFDRKPIPPGKSGSLEVKFDTAGRSGQQTKTISVRSNSQIPVIILKIITEVVPNSNN